LVIVTQVFEYFAQPHEAVRQIHEVLKPGGALLMSAVGFAPWFVNEERWRFTPHGLRSMLTPPFSDVEILPEVFSPAGLIRSVNLFMESALPSGPLKKLYGFSVCPLFNLLGLMTESAQLTKNNQFTANYSVLARK
jgi:SAM-dependent methyltransferase